ncbi:ATP-binding protein [Streptomyces sp. NPDC050704]|uniref:ATP-binding protein n=1 Tax=Streptomyces sp. NPDC050704 TaxID=3157219 RepID=UPI0034446E56
MTQTAAIPRTDHGTILHLRAGTALDVSFARAAGSTAGAVAEADRRWPHRMRRTVRARLRHWGRPDLTDAAELLVTELVTNALRHGRGDVRIRAYLTVDHLRIEVRDGSHDFPVPRAATVHDEDGRGLSLVDAIADDWGYSPDGTTTWCILPL